MVGLNSEEDEYAPVWDRTGSDPFRKKGFKVRYRIG
jgi:hypothetical protein